MLTRAPPPPSVFLQPPRPVMVAAASPSATPLALPASSALPLRGIAPVAARPISHRPAPAFALLLPPRAAAASRSPADDVPDGNSSHLLAVPVPVPMDPAAAEDVPVAKQLQVPDVSPRPPERDFAGTPYVPVYVMLPVSTHLFHVLRLDLRDRVPYPSQKRIFGSLG
ncbi:Beta-amylase 2 chloroplastic [Zea mays]|uniref:Beta-amylase 2 chloroplastic n=1 Tax=Zea mays TaxID=4577 RepID=A0A1D6I098_MAIZE|nr:Beta-amylase 2 chloroplastic [Zea mays]